MAFDNNSMKYLVYSYILAGVWITVWLSINDKVGGILLAWLTLGNVQATDPDCGVNAMVNYTLAAGRLESEWLQARSDTGDICVRSPLDRETATYLEIPVIATDRGGLSTIAIIQVQITDVNDNSPIFEPQKYNVTLRSNVPFQGPILRVVASDLDAGLFGQVAYRITSGNEAGIFRLDRNTGELHVSRPSLLSRSVPHQLNVTATDAAGLKSTVDAEVRITMSLPLHKIATCERPRYVFSVAENQPQTTVIGDIKDVVSTSSLSGTRGQEEGSIIEYRDTKQDRYERTTRG
ncbi:hypothetical protein M0802_003358 [Mischocyttarus mexicanus]|nr:hypothetical protein M0802_003358 [Mischocyttarus mexicanus]